jgi:hypothetical protein
MKGIEQNRLNVASRRQRGELADSVVGDSMLRSRDFPVVKGMEGVLDDG